MEFMIIRAIFDEVKDSLKQFRSYIIPIDLYIIRKNLGKIGL